MKRVAIIGGGISGLTALHYLKQRFPRDVEVTLFEREPAVGGTIRTLSGHGCLFETGPNGFMGDQPSTLQLIEELGLTGELVEADATAQRRYIQAGGKLHPLPVKPGRLLKTSLLSAADKWAMVKGVFKNNISTDQSIYEYVARRFSPNVAEYLADPFITGIYAGDIKRLHLASVFPKLGKRDKKRGKGQKRMFSFKRGMGQLIETLQARHQPHIRTATEVVSLDDIKADAVIVAVPAYAAGKIVAGSNPSLAALLEEVPYAPVAVAGLVFAADAFRQMPDGFGYLVPSKEGKDILGVLIESNVYPGRGAPGQVMLRVMLGGRRHPAVVNDSPENILAKAIKEIDSVYGLKADPVQTFVKSWPRGIPQYELGYPRLRENIAEELRKTPHVHLCANYLDGISFNDCVNNAKSIALQMTF